MSRIDRRRFLFSAAGLAGATLLSPSIRSLAAHGERLAAGARGRSLRAGVGEGAYGPLVQAGPELALPEGFQYVRFGVEGTPMSSGRPTPGAHDGMAAFPLSDGRVRLIRNHELRTPAERAQPIGDATRAYDAKGPGGTVTLDMRLTPDGPELERDFVSINGTMVNCAGGPTPWGSWLTCEETTAGPTQGYEREHGYVFEVPASAESETEAVPLNAMGRFVHEAVAVDPGTGIVHETEDRFYLPERNLPGAGFYRFIPERRGELRAGGRLQMLAVRGQPNYETHRGQRAGLRLPVTWVDIDDADPADAAANPSAVFHQGWAQGAARFQRLEGAWWGDEGVYFHSTNGGDARRGQVWHYRPAGDDGGELVLLFESPGVDVLDGPDNITVSPRGGVLLCEDGSAEQYLRGLTPEGRIFDFARHVANESEFCGACFSPDGSTLFVNVQGEGGAAAPGMSFAIWGAWAEGAL